MSSVARAPAWVTTEYNNQSSPATFYSVGAVESAGTGNLRRWNPHIMPGLNPGFMLFPGGL